MESPSAATRNFLFMIDSYARALRHSIALDKPAVNFFEGALLGNGGLGVVVCTRPDGVVLHFGHNAVWDVRVDESHAPHIGTFREVFERVRAVPPDAASLEDDPWCRDYFARMRAPYAKPYPRPFPCGSLLLAFDRRRVELLGHELCIADGVCTVRLLQDGQARRVEIFVEREVDRVHMRVVDAYGDLAPSPFDRIKLLPDPDTPPEFPDAAAEPDDAASLLSFQQRMPAREPHEYDRARGHADDRAFRLAVRVSGNVARATRENWHGDAEPMSEFERAIVGDAPFVACVQLDHGRADALPAPALPDATADAHRAAAANAQAQWRAFWARSGVALDDALLEATWHRNVYFMNCAARAGVTCPGLFANWSYRSIGTAWHGDYHMNYNTQQPFWMAFSTNHLELHLPYVALVGAELLRAARRVFSAFGVSDEHVGHAVSSAGLGLGNLRDAVDGAEPVVALHVFTRRRISAHARVHADQGCRRISGGVRAAAGGARPAVGRRPAAYFPHGAAGAVRPAPGLRPRLRLPRRSHADALRAARIPRGVRRARRRRARSAAARCGARSAGAPAGEPHGRDAGRPRVRLGAG
jgi:hypothetical protein